MENQLVMKVYKEVTGTEILLVFKVIRDGDHILRKRNEDIARSLDILVSFARIVADSVQSSKHYQQLEVFWADNQRILNTLNRLLVVAF